MNSRTSQLKIEQKWIDMIQYAYVALRQMPKSERFTLGAEIRTSLWAGFRLIIRANTRRSRLNLLYELDVEIKILLGLIRAGYGMGLFPHKQYERLSILLVELGRMLGGWIKYSK